MSIRTSSLRYCVPLVLVAACSSDRVASPPPSNLAPRFSFSGPGPNGRIAFSSDYSSQNKFRIYTMNPDGSDVLQLTDENFNNFSQASYPAWSPDGLKIAFTALYNYSHIFVMAADGNGKTQ